jgi:hypothetical protein
MIMIYAIHLDPPSLETLCSGIGSYPSLGLCDNDEGAAVA